LRRHVAAARAGLVSIFRRWALSNSWCWDWSYCRWSIRRGTKWWEDLSGRRATGEFVGLGLVAHIHADTRYAELLVSTRRTSLTTVSRV
jgi:hypothetical protein